MKLVLKQVKVQGNQIIKTYSTQVQPNLVNRLFDGININLGELVFKELKDGNNGYYEVTYDLISYQLQPLHEVLTIKESVSNILND